MTVVSTRTRTVAGERVAIAFWLALFGVVTSFLGALIAVELHVDVTALEAGFLGAFLGSSPMLALPLLARILNGKSSPLANPSHAIFRGLSLAFVVLVVTVGMRYQMPWWHHRVHRNMIAVSGLAAAMLASWFTPHFPAALRLWASQKQPLSAAREPSLQSSHSTENG